MQIGVPLDELSPLFYGCLAVAIWLVYMFCKQRFAERSVAGSSEWIYQLLPRQLATREEYSKGFLTYFATMAAIVVLLSLLGPKNLGELGITLPQGVGYIIVPFFIAFVLIGALPNVPGLMAIEKYLRAYAHRRAYIPDAALATAERLAAADFDFSSYQGEALQSAEMRGVEPVDFTRSRHSLTHSWARLCCLVFVQKSCRMDGATNSLDASLLRDYEKDLEIIESQKKSMEAEVAAYRAAKAGDPYYTNDELRRAIRDNLYKLYILLGCPDQRHCGLWQPHPMGPHATGADVGRLHHRRTLCTARDGDRRLLRLPCRQRRDRLSPISMVGAQRADCANRSLWDDRRQRDGGVHLRY